MYRRLLRLTSPIGRPATQLGLEVAEFSVDVAHSSGRYLYVTTAQSHVSIAVALSPDQVEELVRVGTAWLSAREDEVRPFGRPFSSEQTPPARAV
jgi:hypothetical protein